MKTKITSLLLSLILSNLATAEITSCKETIKKTFVDDKNRLYAFLEKRNSYIKICELSEPYCKKWDKILEKAAKRGLKKKVVIIKYRNLETSCLDIPKYARAPTPFYIMNDRPRTYQDPIFE